MKKRNGYLKERDEARQKDGLGWMRRYGKKWKRINKGLNFSSKC